MKPYVFPQYQRMMDHFRAIAKGCTIDKMRDPICRVEAKDDARHLVNVLCPGEVYGASLPALDAVTKSPALVVAAERTRVLALRVAKAHRLAVRGCVPRSS